MNEEKPDNIIIYDGYCNLCASIVNWVYRHDKKGNFRYTTQESNFTQHLRQNRQLDETPSNTVIFITRFKIYKASDAVLEIAKRMRFPWSLLWTFKIIPRSIRDWLYYFISRNRYKWFGKNSCEFNPTDRNLS